MLLGEKEFTPNWQPQDFDSDAVMGEETFTVRVEAHADEGLTWVPVSHSWEADGHMEESTTFTDALGRKILAQMKMWFETNKDIISEEPEFTGWRQHVWAENEADRAWANSRSI